MSWIVVASYSYPYEAQIAKARLVSVGIPVNIENEHTINMYWLYSNALGGVRVSIPEIYFEKAKYLLENDFSDDIDDEFEILKTQCPECKSELIEPYTKGKKSAFLFFTLLGFPMAQYEHGYKCQNCGLFFKDN